MSKRINLNAALHEAGAKPTSVPVSLPDESHPATLPAHSARDAAATARPSNSRAGQRVVSLYVKPEVHKQLRLLGIEHNATVQELMTEALNDLFQKHGKSRIA